MAQVWSIEKYEVDSVSNSNLEVVMAGKADHFEHVETQDSQNDLESSQLEPISCSPTLSLQYHYFMVATIINGSDCFNDSILFSH